MRQLLASGAGILVFSWLEPAAAAGAPEEHWYLPVRVGAAAGALTGPQRTFLRKKCLKRTVAQMAARFPQAARTQDLKSAIVALLPP